MAHGVISLPRRSGTFVPELWCPTVLYIIWFVLSFRKSLTCSFQREHWFFSHVGNSSTRATGIHRSTSEMLLQARSCMCTLGRGRDNTNAEVRSPRDFTCCKPRRGLCSFFSGLKHYRKGSLYPELLILISNSLENTPVKYNLYRQGEISVMQFM